MDDCKDYIARPDGRRVAREMRKVYEPARLWDSHHEMLRRIALGQKNVDIARALNVHPQTVSNIRNSSLAEHKLRDLRNARDRSAVDVAVSIREAAPRALKLILDSIEDEGINIRERLRQANSVLDRAGYAPVKQVATHNTHMTLTAEDIDSLKARAVAAAIESGNLIDVDPEE